MKNTILISAALALSLSSCNKENSGNKGVLVSDSATSEVTENKGKVDSSSTTSHELKVDGKVADREESFLYSGLDKSKAKVIFIDKDKTHTITIQSNNQTFILDKKEDKAGTTTYERSGIKAEVTGDSLFIIQGDNIIPLGKVKM